MKKKIFIIILIIIAIILVLDLGVRIYNTVTRSDFEQMNFDTTTEYSLYPYKEDILMFNNDGLRLVDENGREKWYVVANNASPSVDIAGDYILAYDMQGNTAVLYKGKNLMTDLKTEEKIISAKVNKNGQFIIVSDESGYKSKVTVYNSKGEETYKWHSGEYYISDADIAPLGNKIAISQISDAEEKLKSIVSLINISNEEITECMTFDDSLIGVLKFNKNGSFVTLSNSMLSGFSPTGNHKYNVDLSGKDIVSFDLENEDNMVFSTINSYNNTTFEFYGRDGRKRGECAMDAQVKTFAVNGEIVVTNILRDVFGITPSGRLEVYGTVSHDIKEICLYSNRKKALVIGGSMADLIEF